jgi:hypothetical protein
LARWTLPLDVLGSEPGSAITTSDATSWSCSLTRCLIVSWSASGRAVRDSTMTTSSSPAAPGTENAAVEPARTAGASSASHSMH